MSADAVGAGPTPFDSPRPMDDNRGADRPGAVRAAAPESLEEDPLMRRALIAVAVALAGLAVASYAGALITVDTATPGTPSPAPQFEVDPASPKPLPNRWLMGQAAGVAVEFVRR